jgi:hypothetical protein
MPQHAPFVDHTTCTRRMALLTMAVAVVFATTFYQTYLLSSLLISNDEPAMTIEQLNSKLEASQMQVMFYEPGTTAELEMRALATYDRFTRALDAHPPLYKTQLNTTTSAFEVVRDEPVVYIIQLDMDVVDIIMNDIPYDYTAASAFLNSIFWLPFVTTPI